MTEIVPAAALARAAQPLASPDSAPALAGTARLLLPHLEQGCRIDAPALRVAMDAAIGGSDTDGAWDWKTAYDACEGAAVLFLRKYGKALLRKAGSPAAALRLLAKVADLLPSHTRRSEESEAFQQFSTPLALGFAAATAAAITADDIVLEPSAGTGLLAILAEFAGGTLHLNELAEARADLLSSLFPALSVTRFNAAQIDDHLDAAVVPSVVLMNPPFSAMANVSGRMADAAYRHVASALARLAPGGRLVAITGASFAPNAPKWRDAFARSQEHGRVVFTAAIDGAVYARHGTTIDTRLTVIDKVATNDPTAFPASPGIAGDAAALLDWVLTQVPPRPSVELQAGPARANRSASVTRTVSARADIAPTPLLSAPQGEALDYETVDWTPPEGVRLTDALYEGYALQSIRIPGSQAHPTRLVQSAAMASVAPPKPSYRPHLPASL